MSKIMLKDGCMEIQYNVEYHKVNNLLRIINSIIYKSNDENIKFDEKSDEVVLNLTNLYSKVELMGCEPLIRDSMNDMLICKIEPKILSFLKKHTKNMLSKIDITNSIDFYSFKYITRATIEYSNRKCSITKNRRK